MFILCLTFEHIVFSVLNMADEFDSNPFINGLEISTGSKTSIICRIDSSGEISEGGELGILAEKRVDKETFVKAFTDCFRAAFHLNQTGVKVLLILLESIRAHGMNKDTIQLDNLTRLDWIAAGEEERLSWSTFRRGRIELERVNIIAKTKRAGEYYINPAMLFNGDRFRVVNTWELKRSKS